MLKIVNSDFDECCHVVVHPGANRKYCQHFLHKRFMAKHCPEQCGLCTADCGKTYVKQSRIVNGDNAKEGAWPWIASLQHGTGHFCGGSLIKPNWVLTAAHCVAYIKENNMKRWSVKLGAHNHKNQEASVQRIGIKRVIVHPDYSDNTLKADFALLELTSSATLNKRVQLICMPKPGYPSMSAKCYMAGWGYTSYPGKVTHLLQQAQLPLVSSSKCRWQREAVCVGLGTETGTNACRGDSGGPLMCLKSDGRYELQGVASYVYKYCSHYTGYAPVNKYLSWLKANVPKL